ncbi:hypothetical protein B0O99DRAFT_736849 [Bisporella sp. PMI_857]|nr:hypothetical protein B0O99DRAFT_736849 [Bisporella sp. PMI_857]
MATSLRLPLRRLTAGPITSSSLLRTQHTALSASPCSYRFQSTSVPSPEIRSENTSPPPPEAIEGIDIEKVRLPRAVQAAYLRPLRRTAKYDVPSCDLQMRSYSIRNLEFFADFAMRAAYFLGLPAYGPVPLPQIVERWTVPKASFIHTKSKENFERKTLRRLIQIKDGHPETVEIWLAFLQKHSYYGIGMKANVWNYEKLGVAKEMDNNIENMKRELDEKWELLGIQKGATMIEKAIETVNKESFRLASGGWPQVPPGTDLRSICKAHAAATSTQRRFNQTDASPKHVIFSGIQPTGVPHIGNYLGALQQWVELQNASPPSTKFLYSIVDWHAITKRQDPLLLAQRSKEMLAALLAIGLDPNRCIIFLQSSVPQHLELYWQLLCTTTSWGQLSRMTSWKSKVGLRSESNPLDPASRKPPMGLFNYPVLQAADILIHRATHVPVGDDQSQHLELSRNIVASFNHIYGFNFAAPQTRLSPTKRVMSLHNPASKMSKSDRDPRSRILLTDAPEEIRLKLASALTDDINSVSYDPVTRPAVSNLLDILSYFDAGKRTPQELGMAYEDLNLKMFKETVADAIAENLSPVRDRFLRIMGEDDGRYLEFVRDEGGKKARESAEETMVEIRKIMGFWQ